MRSAPCRARAPCPELRFVNATTTTRHIEALAQRDAGALADARPRRKAGAELSRRAERARSAIRTTTECLASAKRLGERLSLRDEQLVVTFQSRFGKATGCSPHTEPTLVALAKQAWPAST